MLIAGNVKNKKIDRKEFEKDREKKKCRGRGHNKKCDDDDKRDNRKRNSSVNKFFDPDGGDIWVAGPGINYYYITGATNLGPTVLDELNIDDMIYFKNACNVLT